MSMFLHHLMPASGVNSFRQSCLRCCPLPLSTSSINWSFKTSCVSQWTPKIGYYGEYENHEIWTKHIFHNVYLFPSKALSVISLCCLVLLLSAWVTSDSFSQDQQKKGGRGGELQLCDWQPQLWLFSCIERGGGVPCIALTSLKKYWHKIMFYLVMQVHLVCLDVFWVKLLQHFLWWHILIFALFLLPLLNRLKQKTVEFFLHCPPWPELYFHSSIEGMKVILSWHGQIVR